MAKNPEFSQNPRSGVILNKQRSMQQSKTNKVTNFKGNNNFIAPNKKSFAGGHNKAQIRANQVQTRRQALMTEGISAS